MQRTLTGRLLKLGRMHRRVPDEPRICAHRAESMCLACTGCDLTPHQDI